MLSLLFFFVPFLHEPSYQQAVSRCIINSKMVSYDKGRCLAQFGVIRPGMPRASVVRLLGEPTMMEGHGFFACTEYYHDVSLYALYRKGDIIDAVAVEEPSIWTWGSP
jgi:hypothetical protein